MLFGSPVAVTPPPSRWQRLGPYTLAALSLPQRLAGRSVRAVAGGRALWAAAAPLVTCHSGWLAAI
jgi:hypothetical protein